MASYPKTNISKSQRLIEGGYEVENLARVYFDSISLPQTPDAHLYWQII